MPLDDEKAWDRAKAEAGDLRSKTDPKYWGLVMSLYKKLTGRDHEEALSPPQVVTLVAEGVAARDLVSGLLTERDSSAVFSWSQKLDDHEVEALLRKVFPAVRLKRGPAGLSATGLGSATFEAPDAMALLRRVRRTFPQKLAAIGVESLGGIRPRFHDLRTSEG